MVKGNIKVLVRLRPYQQTDGPRRNSSITINGNEITVENREKHKVQGWKFKRCLDIGGTQDDVFAAVKPLIDAVHDGRNSTVFTYGVTGSGKTHTISGSHEDPGLIPLTLRAIFERREGQPEGNVEVAVSYLEIYNDDIYDLLGGRREKLQIMDDGSNGNVIPGLTVRDVASMEEFELLFNFASVSRRTASTALNAASSRSHAVLSIYVTSKVNNERMTGQLCLADLAGSENRKAAGGDADRIKEARAINLSLGTLSQVIDAIRTGSARIPYRDSKLTRVLQPALGGTSSALLICCIAPGDKFLSDTINTLNFANRSKQVVTGSSTTRPSMQVHCDQARLGASDLTRPTTSSARRSIMPLVDATNVLGSIAQPRQPATINRLIRPKPATFQISANKENADIALGTISKESKMDAEGGIVRKDLIPQSPAKVAMPPADPTQAAVSESKASSIQVGGSEAHNDLDLVQQFTASLDGSTEQAKEELCRQLLPTLGPMLQLSGTTASATTIATEPVAEIVTPSDTTRRISDASTLVDEKAAQVCTKQDLPQPVQVPASAFLDHAALADIERTIASMADMPAEEREIRARLYCKKARQCLITGEAPLANRYFRLARGCGGKNTSTLTSIIADIEVNGLEGKQTRAALKRPRDIDEEGPSTDQPLVSGSPAKKMRLGL